MNATMLLGVSLLFDKMFKRIYKAIHEKRLTAMIIGPLIKMGDFVEWVGWRNFKKVIFKEQLSSYKQIKKFKIRDQEFEKTTTQKIKRYLVQKN